MMLLPLVAVVVVMVAMVTVEVVVVAHVRLWLVGVRIGLQSNPPLAGCARGALGHRVCRGGVAKTATGLAWHREPLMLLLMLQLWRIHHRWRALARHVLRVGWGSIARVALRRVGVAAADVPHVEGLQRELPVAGLTAASALRDVRIVAAHDLGFEDLELRVNALQLGLYMLFN